LGIGRSRIAGNFDSISKKKIMKPVMMRKCTPILFSLVLVIAGYSVSAQRESKNWSLGFGVEAGVPVGDFKDNYHFETGVTIRFEYKAGPGFLTFTSGVVGFDPKKVAGEKTKAALQIPFKAGYKYIFVKHLFVMGELGFSSFRYYYGGNNNNLLSSATGGFTYAPSIGVNFGVFDAALKYESIAISGGAVSDIGIRLGLNF
jgi:hypothetical protein